MRFIFPFSFNIFEIESVRTMNIYKVGTTNINQFKKEKKNDVKFNFQRIIRCLGSN